MNTIHNTDTIQTLILDTFQKFESNLIAQNYWNCDNFGKISFRTKGLSTDLNKSFFQFITQQYLESKNLFLTEKSFQQTLLRFFTITPSSFILENEDKSKFLDSDVYLQNFKEIFYSYNDIFQQLDSILYFDSTDQQKSFIQKKTHTVS